MATVGPQRAQKGRRARNTTTAAPLVARTCLAGSGRLQRQSCVIIAGHGRSGTMLQGLALAAVLLLVVAPFGAEANFFGDIGGFFNNLFGGSGGNSTTSPSTGACISVPTLHISLVPFSLCDWPLPPVI